MRLDPESPDGLRFASKISKTSTCWNWTGSGNGVGYGQFSMRTATKRTWTAHRLAYEMWVGPIPDGLTIDHLCRNRGCVNPDHMEVVTRGENTLRGDSPLSKKKRQTHCKRGHPFDEANTGHSKLGRYCIECRQSGVMPSTTNEYAHAHYDPVRHKELYEARKARHGATSKA